VSLFQSAISNSLATVANVAGVSVQYARANVFDVTLTDVVQGRTAWKGFGRGGVVVISESVDWLVPVDQLVDSNGDAIEPAQFDTVVRTVAGVIQTYDLQPFGPDEIISRTVDRGGRSVVRLFSKLLSEVSA